WAATRIGKDVFLHSSVPKGWCEEYRDMAGREHDPNVMVALHPYGVHLDREHAGAGPRRDRALAERAGHQVRIRNALFCAVGWRWLVTYWSRRAIGRLLKLPVCVLLFAGATFRWRFRRGWRGADAAVHITEQLCHAVQHGTVRFNTGSL